MKKNSVPRILVPLCAIALSIVAVSRASAFDFFFSNGPFSIGFADRHAPPPGPVVVPVAPPAFFHPFAAIFLEPDYVDPLEAAPTPDIFVTPTPKSVVYGPEYRTAPYLSAVPEQVVVVHPKPAPRPVVVVPPTPGPWPGSYPARPGSFRSDPFFGPGPSLPGPNSFGGMTPLGPGPPPAFGLH